MVGGKLKKTDFNKKKTQKKFEKFGLGGKLSIKVISVTFCLYL